MSALVAVFLAIIAVGAILQAAVVAGLALGVGKAADKVDEIAAEYERTVGALTGKLGGLTEAVAGASDSAVAQAHRLEESLGRLVDSLEGGVETVADRVGDAVDRGVVRVQDGLLARAEAAFSPFQRAAALYRGFSRALSVLRGAPGVEPDPDLDL